MIKDRILGFSVALAALAFLFATAAGCGSGAPGSAHGGHTLVVQGASPASVTCTETPYDAALDEKDPAGTGVVVYRGLVRGAMWVACTGGVPNSFEITVTLKRNGLEIGSGSTFHEIPSAAGYEAMTFVNCTPGVYRLAYSYRWTLGGGVQADSTTVAISETVTAHDCS